MKKSYFSFMIGMLVGHIICQHLKTNVTITEYVVFFIVVTVISIDQLYEKVIYILSLSFLISFPFTWLSTFKWSDLIIELWVLFVLIYNSFQKMKTPIFVDTNDVLNFPPENN